MAHINKQLIITGPMEVPQDADNDGEVDGTGYDTDGKVTASDGYVTPAVSKHANGDTAGVDADGKVDNDNVTATDCMSTIL